MRLTVRFGLLLGWSLLAACAAETSDGNDRLPAAVAGQQGPGTQAPEDEADEDASSGVPTPAPPAPIEDAGAPDATPAPPPTPTVPAKKELAVKWFGQETYYWCGPGSTRMALGTRLADPPSQTMLANFMGTTVNGTDHIGLVANALNKWLPGAGYKTRNMPDPPSAAQRETLKKDLVARISSGFPLVANVISGWRPPEYPAGTIYHYVAVVGYDANGDKALIADPAAEGRGGGASWNNVKRTYWVSTQDLGTWIGGKGYTY